MSSMFPRISSRVHECCRRSMVAARRISLFTFAWEHDTLDHVLNTLSEQKEPLYGCCRSFVAECSRAPVRERSWRALHEYTVE